MKRTHIISLIFAAMILSSCHSLYGHVQTDTDKTDTTALTAPTILNVYWENKAYYVTDYDGGYALFTKNDHRLIRKYSELRTLSQLETDGSISEVTLAVGRSNKGELTVYTLDKQYGERFGRIASDSVQFCGDFVIIDWSLHTAGLRELGNIYALALPEKEPSYNEMITLDDPDSQMNARFYLAGMTERGVQLPLTDDTTDYIEFKAVGNGRYIGIFKEGDTVMSRYFAADLGHATPLGVYTYECTSPAVLMGKVGEFERYRSTNVECLVDADGNFRLCAEGSITMKDGLITVDPFDKQKPMTFYNADLDLLCDNVFAHVKTTEDNTLVWHSDRIYGVSKNGDEIIHENHVVSVIGKDGAITKLCDANNVFALTDIGALIEKDGKVQLIAAHSMTYGEPLATLEGWNSELVYTGQISEVASEYRFVFTDPKDIDKNYDPLRMEWCYTDTKGKVSYKEYYGSVREGFYKLGLAD